jgi:hypothetical protein
MISQHRKSKIDIRSNLYVVKSNFLCKLIYIHIFTLQSHIKLILFLTVHRFWGDLRQFCFCQIQSLFLRFKKKNLNINFGVCICWFDTVNWTKIIEISKWFLPYHKSVIIENTSKQPHWNFALYFSHKKHTFLELMVFSYKCLRGIIKRFS